MRENRQHSRSAWALIASAMAMLAPNAGLAAPQRAKFSRADGAYLIIEVLDDDLMHFEYSAIGPSPNVSSPLTASIMIDTREYTGASRHARSGNVVETAQLRATVTRATLCVSLRDLVRRVELTTICPKSLERDWKSLTLTRGETQHAYGLGQQFKTLGSADGDWLGKLREAQPPGQPQAHGNGFMPFGPAGLVGNVQIPVLYALGAKANYALFLDNVYKQDWDLRGDRWQVSMGGDAIRLYVMSGPDLPDLRKDYMELVGRPPVPPRKAFGLWVSEYGYRNWARIEALRRGLRAHDFPLDGFVLDLFWFGGIREQSPDSAMGRLAWDVSCSEAEKACFPDPAENVAALLRDHVGLMAIEESYVSEHTPTYAEISAGRTPFASRRDAEQRCDPAVYAPVVLREWFGQGSMLDWSDPAVGVFIHEQRRFPNLIQKGVLGHWTDLGEPEKYEPSGCYDGVVAGDVQHADIHNIYNLLWNRSIYDGYRAHNTQIDRRPFILTRSGAPGIQRFGAAMWSGDIGSNLELLATHLNAQLHMAFSGIDYYGSDIGGFRREGMPHNAEHQNRQYERELYTQWFANSAWFDVPVRPHTDNTFQTAATYQTAPHEVGTKLSNLSNLRQRYELIPYYYSLAYRAHLYGEPLIAPLPLYYQNDPHVGVIGHEKLIGRDVLVAIVARHGEYQRDVYLPAGSWVEYHSNESVFSTGEWLRDVPVYRDGMLRLPTYVRAGALLPQMRVTERTLDAFNHQRGAEVDTDLIVRVYPHSEPTRFTLYEDDGATLTFDAAGKPKYSTRTTELKQQKLGTNITVTIEAANGSWNGAAATRNNEVRLVLSEREVSAVRIDGQLAEQLADAAAYRAAPGKAWHRAAPNVIYAKTGPLAVDVRKRFEFATVSRAPTTSVHFVCDNAWTQPGEVVTVVGSIPALGSWKPTAAIPLQANIYYEYITNPPGPGGPGPTTPKWTTVLAGLPPRTTIEWKCLVRRADGDGLRWQAGANNVVTTGTTGFSGSTRRTL